MAFWAILNALQITVTLISIPIIMRLNVIAMSRRGATLFGVFWVLLISLEYYFLGPHSFIMYPNEAALIPLLENINNEHIGGAFSHTMGGGGDIYGITDFTGEYVSLERLLLLIKPFWLATTIHKIMVVGVTYWGAYLLCRRGILLARWPSSALAAFYSVSLYFFHQLTWVSGISYGLIAVIIYVAVYRTDKKYYYSTLAALAIAFSISSLALHSYVALLPAIFLAAACVSFRRALKMIPVVAIFILIMALNWHENIFGILSFVPITIRGAHNIQSMAPIDFLNHYIMNFFIGDKSFREFFLFTLLVLIVLITKKSLRFGIIIFGMFILVGIAKTAPWSSIGLGPLSNFSFQYALDALLLICLIATAHCLAKCWTIQSTGTTTFDATRKAALFTALILALALGKMMWFKAYNVSMMLSLGGQNILTSNQALSDLSWKDDVLKRVVSVPYRMYPNIPNAKGIETFDSEYNMAISSYDFYWSHGIRRSEVITDFGNSLYVMDFKCCASYEFNKYVNLDLLRIANVGYVLSVLPLEGPGLEQIAGPIGEITIPRTGQPVMERIQRYIELLFEENPLRVYALSNPLPRVFAATAVSYLPENASINNQLEAIERLGMERVAIVKSSKIVLPQIIDGALDIQNVSLVADGFDINLSATAASVTIVNSVYSPFWRAYADGVPTDVIEANMVHMAVTVPVGTKKLTLRYERQMLQEKISEVVSRTFD